METEKTEVEDYVEQAKKVVRRYVNETYTMTPDGWVTLDDITVVWKARIVKDWKVFMSVSQLDDHYYLVSCDWETKEPMLNLYLRVDGILTGDWFH